jgi:hypothetical protein
MTHVEVRKRPLPVVDADDNAGVHHLNNDFGSA